MKKYDEFDRDLIYSDDRKEEFIYKHAKYLGRYHIPRIFNLTAYHLKNMFRDRLQLIFIIGFPIMFMVLFAFQAAAVSNISYNIIVINNDINGFEDNPESIDAFWNTSASLFLLNTLQSAEFQKYVHIVGINNYTLEEATQLINNETYDGLIIIEQDFTEKLFKNMTGDPQVNIITINDELAYNLITRATTQAINTISLFYNVGNFPNLIIQNELNLGGFTFFDLFFPSILLASILVCISQVATHFAGEKESGIIKRLSSTAVSRSEILISGALAQFLVTSFQIILMLTLGTILGANFNPNANWLLITLILSLMTFSALGLGLLLASFLKTYNQAGIFSWFIILPLLFLGGIFTYGAEFKYSFLFPTYWAGHALREILLYGINSWDVIGFDIIFLIVFTIIITIIGVLLFQRKKAILT